MGTQYLPIYVGISTTSDTQLWVNHDLIHVETSSSDEIQVLLSCYINTCSFLDRLCARISLVHFRWEAIKAANPNSIFSLCFLIKFHSPKLLNKFSPFF